MFRRTDYALALSLIVAAVGCAPSAEVRIRQPAFQGLQKSLHLASRWAVFDQDESACRYVISFPLPGARSGDKHYHLYLRTPDDLDTFAAGSDQPERERFAGFFIQVKGPAAGLTELKTGQLTVKGIAFVSKTKKRRLQIDAAFDDQTQMTGTFTAQRNPSLIERFEMLHAADVQAISGGKPESAKRESAR